MITLGIEEEVFILEPCFPSVRSLYYLSRLLWSNPKRYYKLTASNFARGVDVKYGMMSGVEVATGICTSTIQLISELRELRSQLANVAEGYIVPIGHLFQVDTPTNVCALQIHVGGSEDIERAYDNIAYFLPALLLLTANSPYRLYKRFGQSYRLAVGYATGPLIGDRYSRFQDLIISKRLGTIEVRALDPVTCTNRIKYVADAVYALANLKERMPLDLERYKRLRNQAITGGLNDELYELLEKLNKYCFVPLELACCTQADANSKLYEQQGLLGLYKQIDSLYRNDDYEPPKRTTIVRKVLQPALGWLGYYAFKFPYVTYKWLKEK